MIQCQVVTKRVSKFIAAKWQIAHVRLFNKTQALFSIHWVIVNHNPGIRATIKVIVKVTDMHGADEVDFTGAKLRFCHDIITGPEAAFIVSNKVIIFHIDRDIINTGFSKCSVKNGKVLL